MSNLSERAKALAEAHWSYVRQVIENERESIAFLANLDKDPAQEAFYLTLLGFHYQTAFVHGYGHGREDALHETRKPAFQDTLPGTGILQCDSTAQGPNPFGLGS